MLLIAMLALWGGVPGMARAHKLKQVRIFHLLVQGTQVQCYINLLLPKSPKSLLWRRLYDRNRNGRLEPSERRALGQGMRHLVIRGVELTYLGQRLRLTFREVQNSKLRGTPRKGQYSWDYRFSARATASPKARSLKLRVKRMLDGEINPVAVIAIDGTRMKATSTSYILRRKGIDRAVCKLTRTQRTCHFSWRPKPLSTPALTPASRPAKRPTSRPINQSMPKD